MPHVMRPLHRAEIEDRYDMIVARLGDSRSSIRYRPGIVRQRCTGSCRRVRARPRSSIPRPSSSKVRARYFCDRSPLESGNLSGADAIQGKIAALSANSGKGPRRSARLQPSVAPQIQRRNRISPSYHRVRKVNIHSLIWVRYNNEKSVVTGNFRTANRSDLHLPAI
jgi:hypothetical protein